jgi:predicted helicase
MYLYGSEFGGHDAGIGIVSLTRNEKYWAVQCKCYAKDTKPTKKEVGLFLKTLN